MFKARCFLLFALGSLHLNAQSDTSLLLPEVMIRQQKAERNGYSSWQADSLPIIGNLSLSERLYWNNGVQVRPNAPGTLSTLSIRGAGAKRSPVLWNGLSLQSPMNGVVDLALIPVWDDDRLELRYGGQSAAQSSGSMGGSVTLESQPFLHKSGIFGNVNAALGSWGRLEGMASAGVATAQSGVQLRAAWQRADNNFPYRNFTQLGKPLVRQANNFGEKYDVQLHGRHQVNPKNTLTSALWHQQAFREIPPTMTQAPTETWQRDRATRAVLHWENRPNARSVVQTRAAWLDEGIFFNLYGRTDSSRARTALLSSDYSSSLSTHFFLKTGLSLQQQWARADGYADSTAWFGQSRLAAYASGERRFRKGSMTVLLRQEWASGQGAPFSWSLGGQFRLGPGQLRLHLSRNVNMPTFNDRFWRFYGRPDLRPERGYSSDVGWKFQKGPFSSETSIFQILMDDWIDWQPGADGIFRPFNLKKVWSRGISESGAWQGAWDKWQINISLQYQYIKVSNVSVYAGEQAALYKQLTYTPSHSASWGLKLQRGPFSSAYLHQFTGARFTTSDNQQRLPAYQTGQLFLRCGLGGLSRKLAGYALALRVENIWNSPYQALLYRPMPGRSFKVVMSYEL